MFGFIDMTQFANADKIKLKPEFVSRYKQLLGDSYDEFIHISLSFLRRAVRVNTLKTQTAQIQKRLKNWKLTPVPWYKDCFWIEPQHEDGRRDIGNLVEHALGYIYVQEPASTLPPLILDPHPGEIILDMCASPGSKTTQMAQMMQNTGLLVANEFATSRISALAINLERMGVKNCVLTNTDGNRLPKSEQFDRILVDAPCSGTGTIRKAPKTLLQWNPVMVTRLAKTQVQLLESAYKMLKKGGTLVYSTCTLEPEENEGVISTFIQKHTDIVVHKIDLPIKRSAPIMQFGDQTFDSRVQLTLRINPQDNDSEGFFVCKMTKE